MWVWVETNKKQAAWGAAIAVTLALVVWFLLWRHGEQEVRAGEALSEIFVPQLLNGGAARPETCQGFLKVAAEYPGYDAGAEAMLLGAGDLFVEGNYDQARAQFERFAREHRGSPMEASAVLGIAACLDAQHKTNEARTAYKSLVDQHPNDPVALQAKFSLGRLYASQPELARNYFEDVARARGSLLSSEAGLRLEELYQQHPELAPAAPPAVSLAPKVAVVAATNTQGKTSAVASIERRLQAAIASATNAPSKAPATAKAPAPTPAKTPTPTPAKAPAKSDK